MVEERGMVSDNGIGQFPTAQGIRLVLPRRVAPHQVKFGLAIALVSLIIIAVILILTRGFWLAPVSRLAQNGTVDLRTLIVALPLLVFVSLGRGIRFGLLVAFGRGEVHITKERIIGVDRWGILKSKRGAKIDEITRLVVQPGVAARSDKEFKDESWADGTNLLVERPHDNPNRDHVGLAHGYPSAVINELAELVGSRIGHDPVFEDPSELKRQAAFDKNPAPVSGIDQPPKSSAGFVRTDDGFSITLPARGYFKGSRGLGSFAILWCGFMGIFSSVVGVSVIQGKSNTSDLIMFAFVGGFWMIGLSMFFFAFRAGRKRAMIDVLEGTLLITRQSVGKARADTIDLREIDRVIVANSGVEINDVPVKELQIWTHDGKKLGRFSEREDKELDWIASLIQAAIQDLVS